MTTTGLLSASGNLPVGEFSKAEQSTPSILDSIVDSQSKAKEIKNAAAINSSQLDSTQIETAAQERTRGQIDQTLDQYTTVSDTKDKNGKRSSSTNYEKVEQELGVKKVSPQTKQQKPPSKSSSSKPDSKLPLDQPKASTTQQAVEQALSNTDTPNPFWTSQQPTLSNPFATGNRYNPSRTDGGFRVNNGYRSSRINPNGTKDIAAGAATFHNPFASSSATMEQIYQTALSYLPTSQGGSMSETIKEGGKYDKLICEFLETASNQKHSSKTPWCGAFMDYVMKQAGAPSVDNPLSAASWEQWGESTLPSKGQVPDGFTPQKGDVVLLKREGGSGRHVGIFAGLSLDGKQWQILGGNQSDSVKLSKYSPSKVVDVLRLPNADSDEKLNGSKDPERILEDIGKIVSQRPKISGVDEQSYLTSFGHTGKQKSFAAHEGHGTRTSWGSVTDATGRYQTLKKTWDWRKEKSNGLIKNFTPLEQDYVALDLLHYRGALPAIINGDASWISSTAVGNEWASFPGANKRQTRGQTTEITNFWYARAQMYLNNPDAISQKPALAGVLPPNNKTAALMLAALDTIAKLEGTIDEKQAGKETFQASSPTLNLTA